MTGSRKTLILGCASTGAKFTPRNHAATGDRLLDSICTGATIRTAPGELLDEARQLYEMGCRYYHYHARNPLTQEQTTDNDIYQAVSRALQNRFPDLMLSFGASRNGSEVQENIRRFGEWERVSHCAIPLHLGGAHFVTIQAAIELQVICELEKQGASSTSTMPPARLSSPTCATTSRRRRWKGPSCRPTPPARAPTTG